LHQFGRFIECEPPNFALAFYSPGLALLFHRQRIDIDPADIEMRLAPSEIDVSPIRFFLPRRSLRLLPTSRPARSKKSVAETANPYEHGARVGNGGIEFRRAFS
jgi:hypothetical protein